MADVEELVEELRIPAGEPAGAIVLLHGRGTSEQDRAPLLDVLDPRERLVGAFPRGPLQLPPIGHHWYAVHDDGQPDAETFVVTFDRLQSWLDGLGQRTGVPIERTVLPAVPGFVLQLDDLPRDRRAPHHRPARRPGPRQLARPAPLGCQ